MTLDEKETAGQGDPVHRSVTGPALVLTAAELTVLEQAHVVGLTTPTEDLDREPDKAESQPEPEPQPEPRQEAKPEPKPQPRQEAKPEPDHGEARPPADLAQARWSLVARGLLLPEGRLPEGTELGLLLQTLLDVRLAADAMVVVERLTGEGRRDLRLLHLVPQGGVVEDVHPEGLHGLDLALSGSDLVAAVTEMVVPADARAGAGEEITLVMADVDALPVALHHPTVLAELTLVPARGVEVGHLVALGPRGCWAGPRPRGQEPLRLAPVEPGWVEELAASWVHDLVPDAVHDEVHDEVRDEGGGTMAP